MALSRFERADDSPGFLLWQLTNLWQQRIRSALAPLHITHVQFVLLASIAWLTDSGVLVSQVMLSRHAHTDVMMTSEVVRTLEEKGLVTRAVHPDDPRARVVSLTVEGRRVVLQAMVQVEAVDEQFFKASGEQASTFLHQMQQLVQANTQEQNASHKK
jgi:DNA-binding MarR family transcriptional regulator